MLQRKIVRAVGASGAEIVRDRNESRTEFLARAWANLSVESEIALVLDMRAQDDGCAVPFSIHGAAGHAAKDIERAADMAQRQAQADYDDDPLADA